MTIMKSRFSSQRGAIVIQVSVFLVSLMAFSAFVVDYGIMWVARGQAQTAADAAALAAQNSMAFDNTRDFPKYQAIAQQVGNSNWVWGQSPNIRLTDVTFPACPPTLSWPPDICVRVNVLRNQARGNPLPTFFANLTGVGNQGVQATATARAVEANASNCLKPWAVGDKWFDTQPGGWDQTARYTGPLPPATCTPGGAVDCYVPPTANDPGTGFTEHDANGNPTYYGYQMVLKLSNPGNGANQIPINSAGWASELCLDNPASPNGCSTPSYDANITGCTSDIVAISPPGGTCTVVDPSIGCLGVKTGSSGNNNAQSVAAFIAAHDPSATWTDGPTGWQTGHINSTQSPSSRIVPVAIIDVPEYLAAGYTGSNGIVRVVNIVGFFLEGTCQTVATRESYLQCPGGGNNKAAIVGRLVSYPALVSPTGGTVTGSFGKILALVR